MGCKNVCIGDVATYRKDSIKPVAGVTYRCYSLPAFDNCRSPEILDGSEILSSKLKIEKGDILVNKLNMRFKRIWPLNELDDNSVCSTEFLPLHPKESVDPVFLLYTLLSDSFTKELSGMRTGTSGSHQRVKPEWVLGYRFDLPDLDCQRKIGIVLAAIDLKIACNAKINGYLSELCDAVYANFIREKRGIDWHDGTLSELIEIKYGKAHKNLADGPYPVYGSGGYMRSVEKPLSSGESVLIPRKGSLNHVMYVDEDFWTVDTMFFTIPRMPGAAKYAYQYVKGLDLASMNAGSAVPSMTVDILNGLQLAIPCKEALDELDSELQPTYSLIAQIRAESKVLVELRDSLLPKLMSGEIDVSKIDLKQLNSHLSDY